MKAFMITGGCCHDYKNQKNIISEGINERVPTKWDIFFEMDEKKSKAKLSQKGWADGYDYIVYNHCFAHEKDAEFVKSITDIHKGWKAGNCLTLCDAFLSLEYTCQRRREESLDGDVGCQFQRSWS